MNMTTAPTRLLTFGYEGLEIGTFLARAKEAGVQTIVDVRQLPLSRKRGFSKSALGAALQQAGIGYVHVPELGCPKDIRNRYKVDGDWAAYTRDFLAYVGTQQSAIEKVARLARNFAACLVCFEADHTRCHRTYVARSVRERSGLPVMHLVARDILADAGDQAGPTARSAG
ncbi:hypothetical protein BH09PSE5_BH09PSE5_09340 [soil metagenome]